MTWLLTRALAQIPMSGETVSDGDADTVQVESTFSGTLLIKNTGAEDRIEINKEIAGSFIDNDNDLKIIFDNDNEIVIEDYYIVDQDGFYTKQWFTHSRLTAGTTDHGGFPRCRSLLERGHRAMLTAFIRQYCQVRLKRESLPL